MITILGPTASGKTTLASNLSAQINGEIISADSRQVYKHMNIGTGKDLEDYVVDGRQIPYHLIDIVDPGYEYNIYEYQRDFFNAYYDILLRDKKPVLCGGSGLYIQAVIKAYKLIKVPENILLRNNLSDKSYEDLKKILFDFDKNLHNTTDISDRNRLIKAIEIQDYYKSHPEIVNKYPKIKSDIFGINYSREVLKQRITLRLKARLNQGMIKEVEGLLNMGVEPEKLKFYGLEYKYITNFILGEISYDEMFNLLNIAIHQFSKRQMTWFRRMQKQGIEICWIDGDLSLKEKVEYIIKKSNNSVSRIL